VVAVGGWMALSGYLCRVRLICVGGWLVFGLVRLGVVWWLFGGLPLVLCVLEVSAVCVASVFVGRAVSYLVVLTPLYSSS
jgi:hypothetical protein